MLNITFCCASDGIAKSPDGLRIVWCLQAGTVSRNGFTTVSTDDETTSTGLDIRAPIVQLYH